MHQMSVVGGACVSYRTDSGALVNLPDSVAAFGYIVGSCY